MTAQHLACLPKKTPVAGVSFFVPHQVGTAVIKAKNGDLASDNFISVVAQESDAGVGEKLQKVLDAEGGIVLGKNTISAFPLLVHRCLFKRLNTVTSDFIFN